jgi:hypothetical protein
MSTPIFCGVAGARLRFESHANLRRIGHLRHQRQPISIYGRALRAALTRPSSPPRAN